MANWHNRARRNVASRVLGGNTNAIMPAIYTRTGLQLLARHVLDMAQLDAQRGNQ